MAGDDMRRGSCLCGAVAYEASGPLSDLGYCHCTQCRKQTGHFFATAAVSCAHFALTREDGLVWYNASPGARRGFCRLCGSTLFWQREGALQIELLLGSIDGPTGLSGGYHIFVADKGDYYTLDDGLPRFPGSR